MADFLKEFLPLRKKKLAKVGQKYKIKRTRRRDLKGDGMCTPLLALKTKEGATRQEKLHLQQLRTALSCQPACKRDFSPLNARN